MLFQSSTVLFSTAFIVQSVLSLTLPSEFVKEQTPVQLPLKEQQSSLFPLHDDEENSQENLKQAAIHARELMQYRSQGVGTLMSTFPQDHADSSLQGLPIGLQEYFAPYPNGDLLLLSLPISNIYHNIDTDPNHSATLSIKDELASIQRKSSLWSANWRRISLFGKLEPVSNTQEAKELYESFHPDATLWDGNDDRSPHESKWVRFKVEKVFYFGGFGDRGAIGWLDMEIFKNHFQHTPEAEDRSRCFHSEGQNLYCDQPDLGPEIKEVEEEFEGECDAEFDEDEDEVEEEDEDDSEEEDLENLVELWEELDQPAVITQIINNNYITHHHHHHYRTAVSSSIEPRASSSDKVIESIEDAVIEIREEMMEMVDAMMEMSDEMMEEDDEEEEFDDEIFSPDKEDKTDEESTQEQEVEEKQEEEVVVEDTENDMLEKAFKSMELAEILGDLVDLTQVDEHQIESNESGGVNFEVTI